MSRKKVAPGVESGADPLRTQMGEENVAGRYRSDDVDGQPVDFLTAVATEEKDYLCLSDGEFDAMCERLADVHDIHEEMIQALERLAEAIRVLAAGTPTVREIEALRGLAMAHAARVSEAAVLLNELQRALADRPLDDLLRALEEPETDRRERKSSKRTTNQ